MAGATLAFIQFRNPEAAEAKLQKGGVFQTILERKFFMDDLYVFLVKKIGLRIGALLDGFDCTFVNGVLVNQTSYGILNIGKIASKLQSGLLQDYLAWALAVGVGVIFWLVNTFTGAL